MAVFKSTAFCSAHDCETKKEGLHVLANLFVQKEKKKPLQIALDEVFNNHLSYQNMNIK